MTPLERAVAAAWIELERQANEDRAGTPHVDQEDSVIDGTVDMPAVIRAVLEAIREPSEAMYNAGDHHCADGESCNPDRIWPAMIDAALCEQGSP